MKTSANGINLIKESESFVGHPYLCPAGIPTIGYGSTMYEDGKAVKMTDGFIAEPIGLSLLIKTLGKYESAVDSFVTAQLNQNQFDALVDFAYNLGIGSLQKSTLLKKLNSSDYTGAAAEFLKWNKSRNKDGVLVELAGLTTRRKAEKALFEKGV